MATWNDLRHYIYSQYQDLDTDEFNVPLQGLALVGDLLEQEFIGIDRY